MSLTDANRFVSWLVLTMLLSACSPVNKPLRLAFIVNQDYYNITDSDLAQTATYANDSLQAKTGKSYLYQGATFGHYGTNDPHDVFHQYILTHTQNPADYIVIFTKEAQSVSYGGFSLDAFGKRVSDLQQQLQFTPGYCNPAGTPFFPPGMVYGAVIDWHHLLGGCGYELQGLNHVHVQDTSFDGQCVNQPGLVCVFQFGEWQCPNLLNDPEFAPKLADRRLFTAESINHELLHNFGWHGNADHQCASGTPADVIAKSAFNMCGTNVIAFEAASQRCVLDKRPMGTICTDKSQCLDSYCYEFGQPIEYQCSHTCATAAACESVPGKDAFCRIRRTDLPETDNSCFYQFKP